MTWRVIGAAAALVSAGVHFWEYFFNGYDVWADTGIVGQAFLANMIGGIVIAILLLVWRSRWSFFLLFGFGLLTFIGFAISATVGLLGVHEPWTGAAIMIAWIVELVAIAIGAIGWVGASRKA